MRHIWDKPLYTMDDFIAALYAAFSNNSNLTVVPVIAVYDYKTYYDQFIDRYLRIYKEELTNHGWQIQRVPPSAKEDADRLGLPGIMTNYRKFAAGGTVDLMHIEPFQEASDVKIYDALVYHPRVVMSNWIPRNARGVEHAIGMSYLDVVPTGEPLPQDCFPFMEQYGPTGPFFRALKKQFTSVFHLPIIDIWHDFMEDYMPPSENIWDYVAIQKEDFTPPLYEYLYMNPPKKVARARTIQEQENDETPHLSLSPFVGAYSVHATVMDITLAQIYEQHTRTIPDRNNQIVRHPWTFDTKVFLLYHLLSYFSSLSPYTLSVS